MNDQHYEAVHDDFTISTDRGKLDLDVIYRFLHSEAYWSPGIPRDVVIRGIEHSLCFGMYHREDQVGFARVISDFATMAYLSDVFVVPAYRGRGLSKWLVSAILSHPLLQDLRRIMLVTYDAQGLYEQFGFNQISYPERYMEITRSAESLYQRR